MNRLLAFPLSLGIAACAQSAQSVDTAPASVSATTTTTTTGSSSRTTTVTTTIAPATLNPVGSYTFTTELNGQAVTGTMSIRSENNALTGTISAHGQGEFPISNVKVENQTLTMSFDTPNGTGTARLEFVGNDFAGAWELAGQSGPMTGKRAP